MNNENMKGKVLSGLFWKLMENGGVQGVQLLVSILLARILDPEEYGVVALLTTFIAIANVFIQQGFQTALIQKPNADETDFSSVFWMNLGVGVLLYLVLFAAAPLISAFYETPELTGLLRVFSLVVLFGSVSAIENALVQRRMEFKHLFKSSLIAVVLSGVAGIAAALSGMGPMSLVLQQLTYQFLYMVVIVKSVGWFPKRVFDLGRVKTLFAFGWKLLCSALIDTVYNNVYALVIGKIETKERLAYYDKGNLFPSVLVTNINGAIQQVMLPALSESQNDREKMRSMMRRSIVTSSYIMFAMMAGLIAVAEPLISLLLTDKWLPAVPFMRLLCLDYALWPFHTANLQAINATGRSEIYLKLEIVKKSLGILLMLLAIPHGILVMVAMKPLSSLLSTVINAYPNGKLLHYSFIEQWRDVLPSACLAAVMGVCVYLLQFLGLPALLTIVLQIVVGVGLYVGLSALFKLECFEYLLATVRETIKKHS